MRPGLLLAICLVAGLPLGGCVGLGAQRLPIDRDDYTSRLRDSEKAELLSNVVAMRYGDAPMFLSVASVISQYTRETSGHVDLSLRPPSDDDKGEVEGAMTFRETPTVTYTPMSGDRFSHSLLAPLPPAALLAMIESGWAADDLFRVAVRAINGVRNTSHAPLFRQRADDDFPALVAAFRRIQADGAMTLRVSQRDKGFSAVGKLRPDLSSRDQADLNFLRRRLGLTTDSGELRVVFASYSDGKGELAIATRSMFEVLQEMSQGVDLPGEAAPAETLVRIHSGARAPADAHVAVQRRGLWFWIAGDDEPSKRAFLLAQVLMSLNDETGGAHSPLVTIPAG